MTTVYATVENMKLYRDKVPGMFAYSPSTGEEFSADPSDYWYLGNDEALIDEDGGAMVLAVRGGIGILHHEDLEGA